MKESSIEAMFEAHVEDVRKRHPHLEFAVSYGYCYADHSYTCLLDVYQPHEGKRIRIGGLAVDEIALTDDDNDAVAVDAEMKRTFDTWCLFE